MGQRALRAQHQVIKEAGESVGQLLQSSFSRVGYKRVHIVVAAPNKEAIEGKLPAVGVYLYNIVVDEEGLGSNRTGSFIDRVVDEKGAVHEVERPLPLWVRLDYLITTWAQTPEEEALLMGIALKSLIETPVIKGEQLKGDSFEEDDYIPIHVTQKLDEHALSRFWSSISQPVKPAVQCWTTVPLYPAGEREIKRVEERDVRFFDLNKVGNR